LRFPLREKLPKLVQNLLRLIFGQIVDRLLEIFPHTFSNGGPALDDGLRMMALDDGSGAGSNPSTTMHKSFGVSKLNSPTENYYIMPGNHAN
jgi:hypothetical protein